MGPRKRFKPENGEDYIGNIFEYCKLKAKTDSPKVEQPKVDTTPIKPSATERFIAKSPGINSPIVERCKVSTPQIKSPCVDRTKLDSTTNRSPIVERKCNIMYNSPVVAPHTPTSLRNRPKDEDANSDSSDCVQFPHLKYSFLYPPQRCDINKRKPSDPNYDEKTLYVPESFLNSQTPAMRQWWLIKQKNMDSILFFKMGKFYELFNEDAAIGVSNLDINFMKGDETRPAHAGFPEVSYEKYSKILIEKGYKVLRIEQTETPAMMEDRCRETGCKTKFDRVVKREICRVTTRGTQMLGVMESVFHSSQNQYLMSLYQLDNTVSDLGESKTSAYGVSFIDVTIGKLYMGQFVDDHNLSKLNILLAHNRPTEVLYDKNNLSLESVKAIMKTGALLTPLKPIKEFWPIKRALSYLKTNHIFEDNSENQDWPKFLKDMFYEGDAADSLLSLEPKEEFKLALASYGAIVYYLQSQMIAEQVLKCASYEFYATPLDRSSKKSVGDSSIYESQAAPMILDHIVIKNLEIFENSVGGTKATLFESLNCCKTHFGQRLLKNWLCNPHCDIQQIENRLNAVEALVDNDNVSLMTEIRHVLEQTPDLERSLSKIKSQCYKSASDARAIMFDGDHHGKAKISAFINLLQNFKRLRNFVNSIRQTVKECNSSVLQRLLSLTEDDGLFPDYSETLKYFDSAFDHELAKKTGKITPSPGVDRAHDECQESIEEIKTKLDDYLEDQKSVLRCRHIEYYGTAKNRYQIQVPETYCKNVPSDYRIETTRKGFKRYYTPTIDKLFQKLTTREEEMKKILDNIMSKIFEQFTKKMRLWQAAIECIAILDVLQSIATFVRSLKANNIDVCRPTFLKDSDKPIIQYTNGRHPILVTSQSNYIPNDLNLDDKLILLSGANMGGKSTLMRQTALLVILAQMGSFVPASSMSLTPVDRIFSRLGASDRLIEGESTFYTELVETSAMIRCATKDSLLLLDELGRGTSTYDGTAIAYSVLLEISNNIRCRCLFSTHYHTLVREFRNNDKIKLAHMACEIEKESPDEFDTDPLKENITFLYKITEGPVARSYGFNVAKLAKIDNDIIKDAFEKAKELELGCKIVEVLQNFNLSREERLNESELKRKVLQAISN